MAVTKPMPKHTLPAKEDRTEDRVHTVGGKCWCNPKTEYVPGKNKEGK